MAKRRIQVRLEFEGEINRDIVHADSDTAKREEAEFDRQESWSGVSDDGKPTALIDVRFNRAEDEQAYREKLQAHMDKAGTGGEIRGHLCFHDEGHPHRPCVPDVVVERRVDEVVITNDKPPPVQGGSDRITRIRRDGR